MSKDDLIKDVCNRTNYEYDDVKQVIDATFDAIVYCISHNETLFIRGFGTLYNKYRAARQGFDMKNNKSVEIPARFVPSFKPTKSLKEAVLQLSEYWLNKDKD